MVTRSIFEKSLQIFYAACTYIMISLYMAVSTPFLYSEAVPIDTFSQTTDSPSLFKSEWKARISLEDIHGAVQSYEQFLATQKNPQDWEEDDVTLLSDTLRIRRDLQGLYRLYTALHNADPNKKTLLRIIQERVAWTLLACGALEPHPKIRFEAILGAAMSGDSRAIPFVVEALRDENRFLRQFGLEISRFFPDRSIQTVLEEIAISGTKEERLKALTILTEQEDPYVETLILKSQEEKNVWNNDDEAHLLELQLISFEKRAQYELVVHLALKMIASSQETERLAIIRFASKKRSQALLHPIIDEVIMKDLHHDVLIEAITVIGCQGELIDTTHKKQLIDRLNTLASSPIALLRLRALWCLAILGEDEKKAQEEIFNFLRTNKDPYLLNLAISHVRGLGHKGISLSLQILQNIDEKKIVLPLESRMTLYTYLLEQQSGPIETIARLLLKTLEDSKGIYLTTSASLGEPFESIVQNTQTAPHPFLPRIRETQDLLLRIKVFSQACHVLPQIPSANEIISFFQERDVSGCEYAAVKLLHGEMMLSLQDIQTTLLDTHNSSERTLSFALIIAVLSREDQAIEIIQQLMGKADLSKESLESALACLSSFQINKTEYLIVPHLFQGPLSIRIRASGCYLSSIAQ